MPGIGRNQAYERVLALGREQPAADDDHPGDRQGPHDATLDAGGVRRAARPLRDDRRSTSAPATAASRTTSRRPIPDRLVIGIDALAEPMGERAATAARKPAKGGRPNLLFVHAAIEALPPELERIADEVYVQLPWGALLEGIVLARDDVLGGIAALCRPGGAGGGDAQRRDLARLDTGALRAATGADTGVRRRGRRARLRARRDPARRRRATRPRRRRSSSRPPGRADSATVATIRASFSSTASRRDYEPPVSRRRRRRDAAGHDPAAGARRERDRAAVQLRDLLDDREPETRAGHAPRGRRPVEAIEHVGQVVGRRCRRRGRGSRRRRRRTTTSTAVSGGLNFNALSSRLRDRAFEQRDAPGDRSRVGRSRA